MLSDSSKSLGPVAGYYNTSSAEADVILVGNVLLDKWSAIVGPERLFLCI